MAEEKEVECMKSHWAIGHHTTLSASSLPDRGKTLENNMSSGNLNRRRLKR